MLSVEAVKGIVLTGLFLMTFIISLIPVKLVNAWKKRALENSANERGTTLSDEQHVLHPMFKRAISLLSCFAAGVFLATCFLDLLPGVRRTMVHVLYRLDIYTGFPMSEFVMVFGFFLILIVEQIVLTYKEGKLSQSQQNVNDVNKPLLNNETEEDLQSQHSLTGIRDESIQEEHREAVLMSSDSHSHSGHSYDIPHSSLRSVILLIALSMHSVFEGLAVGLQKTSGDVIGIFSALILHKSILGFSLGLNLVQSKLSQGVVMRSVLIFSVSAPLGVGVGMGIINLWDSTMSSLVQGLLSGIATGTFLYVTFFEVLPHEFNAHQDRLLKILFLILGYGTVTGILFLSGDIKKPFCAVENDLNT